MSEASRRKELLAQYKESGAVAGVYRIVNLRTTRFLLGSTMNLPSIEGKLRFARSTGTLGALDRRLHQDAKEYGLDAFAVQVLEVLEVAPGRTPAQTHADLEALETLWRERLAGEPQY